MSKSGDKKLFPSAHEDAAASRRIVPTRQTESPAYRLAFLDDEFILQDELRPIRLQLELLKPELLMQENAIESTVVIFGSARLKDRESAQNELNRIKKQVREDPSSALQKRLAAAERAVVNSRYYEEARQLAAIISENCQCEGRNTHVVITGGGPGIMEAANRGAHEAGAKSIGLNIVLPHEQAPNEYITPELCFQFHYFAIRKMHFLIRARALVAFPGGFGTLDELFEALTLIQTMRIKSMPVLLFGREFWQRVVNFESLVEEGTISPEDLDLFSYVETAQEAWTHIAGFNGLARKPE
ncbi:TIGR00730 family Rossman fold protein [Desulfonatronovibrio hydrogenovorans]|uniref:LOG family protein n=1 Tax=Desulfonatronovibrio hydrogenovorans TaxID=53245 RepID=UPI00048B0411|nr:TIGR00730 family Rossman fold protein [Desulfonatronovibrio hydrogenovorans]